MSTTMMVVQPDTLFPPDPTKIGEYIAAGFKIGTDFGQALVTVIIDFVSNLGQFFAGGPT